MLFKQIILFSFLSLKKYNFYNFNNIYNSNSSSKKKIGLIDYNYNYNSNNSNSNKSNINKDIIKYTQYLNTSIKLYPVIANNKTKLNIRPTGIDERFNITNSQNDSEIKKILNNIQNKELLDKLTSSNTNPNISQLDKLKLIENSDYLSNLNKNTINGFKISNGGLMRDWN
jgi:hypothetical protein